MVVSTLLDIFTKCGRKKLKLFDKIHDANKKFFYSCNFYALFDCLYIMYNINYLMLIISIYDARNDIIIDTKNDALFDNTLSIN